MRQSLSSGHGVCRADQNTQGGRGGPAPALHAHRGGDPVSHRSPPHPVLQTGQHGGAVAAPLQHRLHREEVTGFCFTRFQMSLSKPFPDTVNVKLQLHELLQKILTITNEMYSEWLHRETHFRPSLVLAWLYVSTAHASAAICDRNVGSGKHGWNARPMRTLISMNGTVGIYVRLERVCTECGECWYFTPGNVCFEKTLSLCVSLLLHFQICGVSRKHYCQMQRPEGDPVGHPRYGGVSQRLQLHWGKNTRHYHR